MYFYTFILVRIDVRIAFLSVRLKFHGKFVNYNYKSARIFINAKSINLTFFFLGK